FVFKNYVIKPGHIPMQAIAPEGNWPGPRYLGPDIEHFGKNWDLYFATQMNNGTINWINRHYHENLAKGTLGIFVAWPKHNNVLSGQWNSRLLHFPALFNNV